MLRKSTDFAGWQTDKEWLAFEEEMRRADEEQVRKVLALGHKPVYMPKWGAIIGAMFALGAIGFVLWKIVEALPRFIEAWR